MIPTAKPKISPTRVYKTLTEKMNPETAQVLLDYLEEKIPADIQDSIKYLATKEDVSKLENKVAYARGDLKEEIANVKGEISKKETKLTEKINAVGIQVAHVRGEFSEGIAELAQTVLQIQVKMEESIKVQTRWMIGLLLTILLTLFFKK